MTNGANTRDATCPGSLLSGQPESRAHCKGFTHGESVHDVYQPIFPETWKISHSVTHSDLCMTAPPPSRTATLSQRGCQRYKAVSMNRNEGDDVNAAAIREGSGRAR